MPVSSASTQALVASMPAAGAAPRPAGVVAFERGVVELFADTAELLGIPKSVASIYAIVFASPEPLTFAEIEERLQISKGSVSQGLRALREIGAVREMSTTTDRLERFGPDLEMRKLIQRFLKTRIQTQLDQGRARLAALADGTEPFAPKERAVLQTRLRKLQRWHQRTRQLLPVVTTFLRIK